MDQHVTDLPPTSTAATNETEPEVVAAISSAEGDPDLPTQIRTNSGSFGLGGFLMLLAAGTAIGFGAACLLRQKS